MKYIYLHGFASSPQSVKAQEMRSRFAALQLPLETPDLNQGDFTHLTLSRQLQQVRALFPDHHPVTLIGSSFGGLTAAWLGQHYPQITRLVLLAPAFDFLTHWLAIVGAETMQRWQTEEYLSIYHYSEKRNLPLNYQFIRDLETYRETQLTRPVPTLILHGLNDEVIPIQSSRDYAATRPWVELIELQSDHALADVMPEIWQAIFTFCHLSR